jgi:benzoate 4-monooxygenase
MPVAGSGSGRTLPEDIEYKGILLPANSIVITPFYAIFRQPWIHDANSFIPERWSPDNPQYKDLSDMLMPFSLGKRSCVGKNMANMQLRLFAANFIRYYDFELPPDYDFFVEFSLTLRPKYLNMKVTRRT